MTNITLAIPEELHQRMKKHSEIRWSEVIRKSLTQKVEVLDLVDKIALKSKLTKSDVAEISQKINKEVFKEFNQK